MSETSPLRVIRKKLKNRIIELSETISSGSCKNFDEYRNLCGVIYGLAFAEREILDLQNAMEQNDE